MSLPCLRGTTAGTEVQVLVQPRASRTRLVGLQGDQLKVALTAPPVDGAANQACRVFLAKLTGLPKSAVQLVAGTTSRRKRFLLADASPAEVRRILLAQGLDIDAGSH